MNKIDELLQIGQTFNFRNNSTRTSYGTFSKASDDLLGWAASVGDFIRINYGEDSSAYKLYLTFDQKRLTGYEEHDFERQMAILNGALKSCKTLSPKKAVTTQDNPIIQLIKEPIFWSVLVFGIGASFALGFNFGNNKFDKDKIELSSENERLKDSIKQILVNKDVAKYVVELSYRNSQIDKFLNQSDTINTKDKWLPSLFIWRAVSGDIEYESVFKEFKGISMIELVNWIKSNSMGKKSKNIDDAILILRDFEDYRNKEGYYDVKVVRSELVVLKSLVNELK